MWAGRRQPASPPSGEIPTQYTCNGADTSPPLTWSGLPDGTRSLVLVVEDLLPRYGVETVLVDGRDLAAWEEALAPGAVLSFCESPSNPATEIMDGPGEAE